MKFEVKKLIRFHHCDPAGIVFYPQFFYLLHEVQEDFLAHIGHPEHEMIARGAGVPIVDMKTGFVGMCRFGDEVSISLGLFRLGASSIGMHYEIHSCSGTTDKGQSLKLHAKAVVVYSQLPHGKALRIPDPLRAALQPYLETPLEDKA
ncbi:MAG: acyl-CoA thioesterase [Polaromonas sp.]|uniref:acyl-CoA thioesterase n=1 Tax=Polaromonas sp. TaxID=1869339 RepID=UPI0027302487|nr:acyl-CoA thioesterase [Polaromonas sp.]MDP1739592.1 acyl-CoA thioesterase [Polaromonas sp.]MDP1955171.1 acyl-CoA thioesterase [Polaromonas sp.]MDP3752044.1 acyl-CoA thioesterase [Polaromonas sp.]